MQDLKKFLEFLSISNPASTRRPHPRSRQQRESLPAARFSCFSVALACVSTDRGKPAEQRDVQTGTLPEWCLCSALVVLLTAANTGGGWRSESEPARDCPPRSLASSGRWQRTRPCITKVRGG